MIDQLEYNTERVHLIIPEYGRHIQKMVNDATAMEDAEERNKTAKAIIAVMGNLQPHLRDVPDFQHKLWDQLFIMSDFQLDVESPYGKPSREELAERPEPLEYPQNHPKYRFYGNNIKRMIDVAVSWDKGDMREGLAMTIANHMKKCFLNWNKDTVDDDVIFDHLFELSNGEINLKERDEELRDSDRLIRANKKAKAADNPIKKRSYSKNNNNNNNRKKRY
ncbi:uncharacterized protein DUF4290 [Dokdonia sp. Hel_I_63]|uniref:DUF4290 domain-containing protein n=1 Tax=unclassified Dokdonia TaxID=2615033 RepID=UPI00020A6A20|nr:MULTISPECIES: DUF4290 domain-containing protein [unclassified Dokdonia]AEE20128.1 hypothetical protein Krodi_2146 [Dokdonia sp. 4H-3-7-5]TVZ23618.1 uncharacterized protein DUF4290 [Dokdonia sp. Hel_I_63]